MITRRARIYFFSLWNLTDLLSTILSLVSVIAIRRGMETPAGSYTGLRTLCAVTTGFLWLRVLSFLKGINMQLATFVLAIIQVSRDNRGWLKFPSQAHHFSQSSFVRSHAIFCGSASSYSPLWCRSPKCSSRCSRLPSAKKRTRKPENASRASIT